MPTYFVQDANDILSRDVIRHFDLESGEEMEIRNWLPGREPVTVVLTAGASCPDSLLDEVVTRMTDWYPETRSLQEAISPFVDTLSE